MRRVKVLAVCGFGIGTSLMLKMSIEKALKNNGIDAEVTNTDITTAASTPADIIFTSAELYNQLKEKVEVPVVQINNFISSDEIQEKGVPYLKELVEKI